MILMFVILFSVSILTVYTVNRIFRMFLFSMRRRRKIYVARFLEMDVTDV